MGICAFTLTFCRKSQVFPPKASNVQASFKSKIHLGLRRGAWWSWALLLLRQVQERPLADHPSPGDGFGVRNTTLRVSWDLQSPMSFRALNTALLLLFPVWVRGTVPVWVLQSAVQAPVILPSANLLLPVLLSTESVTTASVTLALVTRGRAAALGGHNQTVLWSNNWHQPLQSPLQDQEQGVTKREAR